MNRFVSDNPLFAPLFGDPQIEALFSFEAMIRHFLTFEIALTRARMALRLIDPEKAQAAIDAMDGFEMMSDGLEDAVKRDGLAVPFFVEQLKGHAGPDLSPFIHTGSTSQDVIDTSLCLALRASGEVIEMRLADICDQLGELDARFGSNTIIGRTRMQAALEIKVSDRISQWMRPLAEIRDSWNEVTAGISVLQLGGPVGDRRGFEGAGDDIADLMATELGLAATPCWHTDRRRLLRFATTLCQLTNALGKIGTDLALMSQQGLEDVRIGGAGGSSAMPHKRNPIRAELLTAFAHYSSGQLGMLSTSAVHEQERSGAAWTLEWMVLPPIVQVTGRALVVASELLGSIDQMGRT